MHRPQDFALLLGFGAAAACASTVDDDGGGGDRQDDVDAAVAVCGPFAERVAACYASEADPTGGPVGDYYLVLLGYCISYLGYSTEASCRAAMEEYYACIAGTECEVLVSDDASEDESGSDTGDPPRPCETENDRMETECDLFEEE